MTLTNYILGLGLVGLAGTFSGVASAQTCATDADCVAGYTCKSETVTSVSTPPCAPDTKCDAIGTETTTTVSYCAPKACATDSDCAKGMVCHSTTSESCTGGVAVDCVKGTDCPASIPPECTTVTTSACAYTWQLPCNTDSECGEGFTCEPRSFGMCTGPAPSTGTATATTTAIATGGTKASPVPGTGATTAVDMPVTTTDPGFAPKGGETTVSGAGGATGVSTGGSISGGGGSVSSSGGSIEIGVPTTVSRTSTSTSTSTCTTWTEFPGTCKPKATTCATDADCPSIFVCQDVYVRTLVVGSGGATTGAATEPATAPVAMPADLPTSTATVTTTTLVPRTAVMACVSPVSTYGGQTVGTKDASVPTTALPGSSDTGTSRETDTSTTTTGGTTAVTANGSTGAGTPQTETAKSDGGGCQLGHSGDGALWGLSLLGLAALVSRRRRRA